ncbi:lipoprotein [Streptomyces spiralis]|uniref:Lipoprotein n=2 Tax=Streptomyces spiralis TaxID=66376 RepID=A0A919A5X2_9ACTN|nr:lipoprotein [Streptomyces spiralis]
MLAAAGAVAAVALAGCGSGGDAAAKVPPVATGSLESLAAEVKCKPDIQTDADTIRQAICTTSTGRFVLATFSTDRGQREWINEAKDYGGYYLVGRKWVAVGDDGVVRTLRGTLGGDVEIGTDHHAHAGHGG